jgi:hypothetical protein
MKTSWKKSLSLIFATVALNACQKYNQHIDDARTHAVFSDFVEEREEGPVARVFRKIKRSGVLGPHGEICTSKEFKLADGVRLRPCIDKLTRGKIIIEFQ